mgnify:CR=1 FL=1
MTPTRLVGAAALTALMTVLFAGVARLATLPVYNQIPAGTAVVKLSFSHGSDRAAPERHRRPHGQAVRHGQARKAGEPTRGRDQGGELARGEEPPPPAHELARVHRAPDAQDGLPRDGRRLRQGGGSAPRRQGLHPLKANVHPRP